MNLFPVAYAEEAAEAAQAAAGAAGGTDAPVPAAPDFSFLILMACVCVFFYFLVLRPGSKKNKERAESLKKLAVGDEVLTSGGIIGRIAKINDELDVLTVEISPGLQIKIGRQYVASPMPKGTYDERKAEPAKSKK